VFVAVKPFYQVRLPCSRWLANSGHSAFPSLAVTTSYEIGTHMCVCVMSHEYCRRFIELQTSCRRQCVVLHSTKKRTPQQNLHSATNWRRSTTCTLSGGQPACGGPVRVHHVTGSNLHNAVPPAQPSFRHSAVGNMFRRFDRTQRFHL
jgi:hypothetical protein